MSYEGHQGNAIMMCWVGKSIWYLPSVSLYRCPYGPQNVPKVCTTFLFVMWLKKNFFFLALENKILVSVSSISGYKEYLHAKI